MAMTHLVSLPNRGRAGSPKFLHSDDPKLIARWVAAEDRPGFGVYDILNPLKPGTAVHGKDNMAAVAYVFVDVDGKDIEETLVEAALRLRDLPLRPTRLTESGHGWHVVYELKEPIECDDPDFERAIALQAELIDYLAADPSVRPWSLLRRPDTTNSKDEPHVPCRTLAAGSPVDLTEIDTLCELVRGTSLLTRKAPKSNGHDTSGTWDNEQREPTDVAGRLAAMTYEGGGDTGIHATQRDVSASELRNGCAVEFVVEELLAATKRAVEGDKRCVDWDWAAEEHGIKELCFGFINKLHPELHVLLPDSLRERWEQALATGRRPKVVYAPHIGWHVRTFKAAGGDAAPTEPGSKAETGRPADAAKKSARVILRPWTLIDPATLPPREYLYGKHFQRRVVSATVAPGGTGKTSLGNVEGVAMATVRNLLGEQPKARCKVWIHNGEDSRPELLRRIVAICQRYNIPQEELVGWLFLTSGTEMPLKVANGYSDLKIDTPLIEEMTQMILENEIDVVMLDPLVTIHSINENDNGKMDAVVRIFSRMADVCDCAIDLSQHTRKLPPGTAEHTADDARGASSVHDAVRAQRVLNVMSAKEAENAQIDDMERRSYFRVDRSKSNTAPPAKMATWRKFENVSLANGDDVGVVTPAAIGEGAPSEARETAAQKAREVYLLLLDRFERAGRTVGDKPGKNYAPALFAMEPEAKKAKAGKVRLEEAQRHLFADGAIRIEDRGKPSRPSPQIVRTL
jgi:RecA-family ATPase